MRGLFYGAPTGSAAAASVIGLAISQNGHTCLRLFSKHSNGCFGEKTMARISPLLLATFVTAITMAAAGPAHATEPEAKPAAAAKAQKPSAAVRLKAWSNA